MFNLFKKGLPSKPTIYNTSSQLYNALQAFAFNILQKEVDMLKNYASDSSIRAIQFKGSKTDAYLLEREMLCLVALYSKIDKIGISTEEYQSLGNLIVEKYRHNNTINDELKIQGTTLGRFVAQRHEFYWQEVDMLFSMQHPHPGHILYYLYHPLKKYVDPQVDTRNPERSVGVTLSTIAVMFFSEVTRGLLFDDMPNFLKWRLEQK